MDRPGTGASNLVNALLVIALFLLGIVLVSFLMFRKSLRRLLRVRTQPCQLDISSSIESKLEQLNRLPPSPITGVSFHDALQTQALTTAIATLMSGDGPRESCNVLCNQRVTGSARERSGMLRSIFFKNLRTRARKLDP
jgi:hypothetical protein